VQPSSYVMRTMWSTLDDGFLKEIFAHTTSAGRHPACSGRTFQHALKMTMYLHMHWATWMPRERKVQYHPGSRG